MSGQELIPRFDSEQVVVIVQGIQKLMTFYLHPMLAPKDDHDVEWSGDAGRQMDEIDRIIAKACGE